MAKKYKVVQKFVVTGGLFDEVKTFSNQGDADTFATMLNDIYDTATEEGIKKGKQEAMMEAIREKSRNPTSNIDV